MLHKSLNLITFVKSDEAEASSAGEQLVRNNLINENNDEVGENLTSDLIIIFVSYPLKNSINFYSLFHFPLKQYNPSITYNFDIKIGRASCRERV